MKLETTLDRRGYLFFLLFFLAAIFAFWLTYFTRLDRQASYRMHTHGIGMILWCLMLITQALLIRLRKHRVHRRVGKFSFVLVPFILWSTLDLLKFTIDVPVLTNLNYYFIALVINALVAFLVFYGLAIYNVYRKRKAVHARLMLCTVFPMVTPVTDRIIYIHVPDLLQYVPLIDGATIAPFIGFLMVDTLLVFLSIWDWISHRRWNVFPFVLAVMLVYHFSVLNFYKFEFWQAFCDWVWKL